jgi:platelet-activating factor acetylhydrolase
MAIYGTTFPAQPNVPLRSPETLAPEDLSTGTTTDTTAQASQQQQQPPPPPPQRQRKKWPLMIFSHGVGCSRLMYSTFCGEMASRGYIVVAIEHRDGTSPVTTIIGEDGQTKRVDFLSWKQLQLRLVSFLVLVRADLVT